MRLERGSGYHADSGPLYFVARSEYHLSIKRTTSMARSKLTALEPYMLSLFRFIVGFLFAPHGAQKLFGWLGGKVMPFGSLIWLAGVLEFFGGLLIMFGLFTRPVAFLLSGMMAYAYFSQHATGGFWPLVNRGELAVVYCFAFLYLVASGPGPVSLDRLFKRV